MSDPPGGSLPDVADENLGTRRDGPDPADDGALRSRALAALMETAFLLERSHAEIRKTMAFRRAQTVIAALTGEEFAHRLRAGTLLELPGIGKTTEEILRVAASGGTPAYLERARAEADDALIHEGGADPSGASGRGAELLAALRGDLHAHSEWSDGSTPIAEMAETARALGHEYLALTDHSPRLTVANGLSRERLERQLEIVAALNGQWDDFRLLTGIEVDILDDGALDQDSDLLERLDVVVASVHSKLRMPSREMTPRILAAVSNPVVTVLGHCTGRMTMGRADRRRVRPPSEFDSEVVFTACREAGVAVEINCRPERRDPPMALLKQAVELGCTFAIDTDAHAPGQLAWQPLGVRRAAEAGVPAQRVINTLPWPSLPSGS